MQINLSKLTKKEYYLPVGFFILIALIGAYIFFTPNYYDEEEPVKLEIPKGYSLARVIDTLYVKNIIPNKTSIRIAAFLFGAETKIKAGRYKIPNGLSYIQLIDLLLEGQSDEQELVTIPEGIWQKNLAGLLKNVVYVDSLEFVKLSSNKQFIKSLGLSVNNLEGYLLPETYYLYKNSNAEEIIRKLKSEMDKIFVDSVETRMSELKMTRHQILTIASIIDGESNIVSEYKRISGVYHNRLKKGMKLQADPTIQYLIRDRKHNKILYKDLEINSRYNTYMYYGLPPTPINNPGKDAIYAALYPEKHDYYYFVADGDGGHVFSKTFAQHLRNVEKYRQWRRQNQ
ncbi:MAG: hypothetical protein A2V66_14410 [Ignavibacteria bacterium RBG_13_36_8]|nr:MAG: hypothetical protein A2V66_14410 [Ignavibacteria bacterium RBG_13_36_8]